MNFGVFYTCYKEREAVDYSIGSLKHIYPNCPIYLVSDGGGDYSFLEQKYTNIKTVEGYDSRGISQSLTFEKLQLEGTKEKVLSSILEFFKRNIDAIEYCKTDNMLIMEPDVVIRGELNHFPTDTTALLGSRVNTPNHPAFYSIKSIIENINKGTVLLESYGSTPAFYRSKAMKEVSDFVSNNLDTVKQFISLDANFVCYDVFLTYLFACCGYDECFNPDIIECLRDEGWKHKKNPLVHQYRDKYPKENYDGRHYGE